MKNRWDEKEAHKFIDKYRSYGEDWAMRTYSARLIGQDPALVLHGGGNTSVKSFARTLTGERVPVLFMKGSGWDLASIEPAGHPAIRLEALKALRSLTQLSDEDMVNALRINMLDSTGPNPSVETLLHAFLPHKFIDHTHADAVLSLTNQPKGEKIVRDWAGNRMAVVPYIMPGFALSKLAGEIFEKNPHVEGMILIKHGIFTFGKSAQESYNRMIYWVDQAEKFLNRSKPFVFHTLGIRDQTSADKIAIAANIIRGACRRNHKAEKQEDPIERMIVRYRTGKAILNFAGSREAVIFSQSGPATPDHVIRTKAKPIVLPAIRAGDWESFKKSAEKEVSKFQIHYQEYFIRQCRNKKVQKTALDPLPRIFLVPGMGLFSVAADAKAADIALDIYERTIDVIGKASRIGKYEALPESDLFDMEYWSLEQAKLGKTVEKPFSRKIVWISGAASGIGFACANAFGKLGAHVFLTDINKEALKEAEKNLGLKNQAAMMVCDVTHPSEVKKSFDHCSVTFGGVDIVISNAGFAPISKMASCPDELLRKSFEVNFFAHQNVARTAVQIFERQHLGGVLLFNASKSTFNPGPEFGPYTLPKASVIAMMKQYAVELGAIRVRCNAVNADRVRTGLYKDHLLEQRAKARDLTVQEYLSGNLVKEEVYAEDVAGAFVYLAQARKTTGTVIPVDGGNAAAFPR